MSGYWRPAHDKHAIDAVAFLIFFNGDFPPFLMQKLKDRTRRITAQLGMTIERPLTGVQLGLDGATSPLEGGVQYLSTDGLTATQVASGEWVELVSLENNSFGYRHSRYTRWADVRGRFFQIIGEILPLIKEVMSPNRVRLEYGDRFVWEGVDNKSDPNTLFRPNSKYVAPHVYDSPQMWHSFTGSVLNTVDDGWSPVLQVHMQTTQSAVLGTPGRTMAVSMMTAREDRFESSNIELSAKLYDVLEERFERFHRELKAALADVITDQLVTAIELEEPIQ